MCGGIKKGVTAHRAAPLVDSPTSIQMAQTFKKHCHRRTTEHELNRVANSSSLEEWRAVFPVVIGFRLRPSQTCKCTREYLFSSQSAAKVQQNFETTKDKGQKRALERESRVRQSLMEGKLLWKRAEIASDYSDLNQGLYKQPGMLSEPAVQVRVHPQSDLSAAKVRKKLVL